MTADRPLEGWEIGVGLLVYVLALLGAALSPAPRLLLSAVVGWGVLAAVSGLLYEWRDERFIEGFSTGVVCWPLSIPFAIFGLKK